MKKFNSGCFILMLVVVFLFTPFFVHAELQNRGRDSLGYQLFYDSDLNITWYDYSPYSTWQNQVNLVSALTVDVGGTIYDDWRLPTSFNQDGSGPCSGFNCTESEMGHLYYIELGNPGNLALQNAGAFENLSGNNYWSGTETVVNSNDYAWYFAMGSGGQGKAYKHTNTMHVLAVRTGDVAVAPEPISSALFIVGGATLGFRRFREKFRK